MSAQPGVVELIPREVLFGNPDRYGPQLSPCGRWLTYIAPRDGVLNIWLRSAGGSDDRPLTNDKGRGVRNHFWAYNGRQVLYMQDQDGDENTRLYAVDAMSGATVCLTPVDAGAGHKVKAVKLADSQQHPDELLIGLNDRDETCHDVYHLDLLSGERTLVKQSWPTQQGWLIDHDLNVRGYLQGLDDGGAVVMVDDGAGGYRELLRFGMEDYMGKEFIGFTPDSAGMYFLDPRGLNAAAVVRIDLATGGREVLFSDPGYDVHSVSLHPVTHALQAAFIVREKGAWTVLDRAVAQDFERLEHGAPGCFVATLRSLDDQRWLVVYLRDDGPWDHYIYDRASGKLDFLFHHRDDLSRMPLVQMRPVRFAARDGLELHGYLTLPHGWQGPGPLVLNVHGGPWGRDIWGYNAEAQWLANRGYACLQVNFRGSMGYGKDFVNAGDREWGAKMQDDLSDAVAWAVAQGIADPQRVVIYGGSYGGYAALAGVTFTPELYRAGVSIVGPSNMETFLNTIPPYWENMRRQMDLRVGRIPRYSDGECKGLPKAEDDFTPEERAEVEFLRSRSPLFSVDRVRVPMLIAQGANDPRVNKAESDQFVDAMRAKGLDVEYVVYANEGHGFGRPENRLDFYARAEKFLARILGGRCEE
jgi:dipeptidyl aminopeptidase/acylaminoacyl peptidase